MLFRYNSLVERYKTPFGAVSAGEEININLEALDGVYVDNAQLVLIKDGEEPVYYPMEFLCKAGNISMFNAKISISTSGLYWYYFLVNTELGAIELYKGKDGSLVHDGEWYQITVYERDFVTPKDIKGGLIYHIFVDRFARGVDGDVVWEKNGVHKSWDEPVTIVDSDGVFRANDFYGGNFQGIIDKLSYLKDLGVTMLYLSPIFKSGSNHRYDTGDYMQVDELLGTEERFAELLSKAHSMGMQVMLDGVFNHTGSDSKYFNKLGTYDSLGAYQGIKSPYYDWYYFINYPNEYACWWGITVTPTVNKRVESYQRFIYGDGGVIDKWTKLGVDGWRLDVVDELDIDFVYGLNNKIKAVNKDALIIGEVWEDASNKIAYSERRPYLMGKQLDGVMNYPFKTAIVNFVKGGCVNNFVADVMRIYENYPLDTLNCSMTFLGTHDTVRAINYLSDADINGTSKADRLHRQLTVAERAVAVERMKRASVLQYVLPGVPSVYYGDEIGMEGYEDPINRKPFTWGQLDNDLLSHYKSLGAMRAKYKPYFAGKMNIIQNNEFLCIERLGKEGKVSTYFNISDQNIIMKQINGLNCLDNKQIKGDYVLKKKEFLVCYTENE